MKFTEVLQMTINNLGANYNSNDENVLKNILKGVINSASFISNRDIELYEADGTTEKEDENLSILSWEIITATTCAYLDRGVENVKSQSELGQSNTFVDFQDKLRNDIIKNGKRIIK